MTEANFSIFVPLQRMGKCPRISIAYDDAILAQPIQNFTWGSVSLQADTDERKKLRASLG